MGDAWPMPGSYVFHAMFSSADHFVGTPFSRLLPSPRGPRQVGQSSAAATEVSARATEMHRRKGK